MMTFENLNSLLLRAHNIMSKQPTLTYFELLEKLNFNCKNDLEKAMVLKIMAPMQESDNKSFKQLSEANRLIKGQYNMAHIEKLKSMSEHFEVTENVNGTGWVIKSLTSPIKYEYFPKRNRLAKHPGGKTQWYDNGHRILIDIIAKYDANYRRKHLKF